PCWCWWRSGAFWWWSARPSALDSPGGSWTRIWTRWRWGPPMTGRSVAEVEDRDLARAAPVLAAVREHEPLVHCLTATVSMAIVADGLLAAGARPMMTETRAEAPVVTTMADALTINLGTLSTDAVDGIPPTVAAAVRDGRPWVLDPTA